MASASEAQKTEATALLLLSEGHLAEDEAKDAQQTAAEALALFKSLKDAKGEAEALRAAILAEASSGEPEAAAAKAQQEAEARRKAGDARGEAVLLLARAEAQLMAQDFDEALQQARAAAGRFRDAGDKAWQAKAGLAAANALLANEVAKDALASVEEAVELCKAAGDRKGEAEAWQLAAVAQLALGDAKKMVEAIGQSVKIYKEIGLKKGEGLALQNLAEAYLSQKLPGEAVKAAQEAWKASKEAGHASGAAGALVLLAKAHEKAGSGEEAEKLAKGEAAACRAKGDKAGEAAALQALFQVRLATSTTQTALYAARRALAALTAAKDSKGAARMLHSIAALEFGRGYWELALRAAREALKLLQEAGGGLRDAAALETLVAQAHEARGEEAPSAGGRAKALKVLEQLGAALEERNVEAFDGALKQLKKQSGVTDADTQKAFAPATKKDPEGAEEFLSKHMPVQAPTIQPVELQQLEAPYELRSFPVREELQFGRDATSGSIEGVDWQQSLGRMVLQFPLQNGPHEGVPGGWKESDVMVEMSKRALKVTLGGEPLKSLSADLMHEIWCHRSWWELQEGPEAGGLLVFHLHKRKHQAWKAPWYSYELARYKHTAFAWQETWKKVAADAGLLKEERDLTSERMAKFAAWKGPVLTEEVPKETDFEVKPPGRPIAEQEESSYMRESYAEVFQAMGDARVCSADEICMGITAEQDEAFVTIQVHFDRWQYEELKARLPVETLFAADVWQRQVCIFFRGDKQNPILLGELAGTCVPWATTWRLMSAEAMRKQQAELGSYSPALEVRLEKAQPRGKWERIFSEAVQHPLMAKDAAAPGAPARHQGLAGAQTLRRSGFDLDSEDFWGHVDDYVNDTMRRMGHSTAPRRVISVR